MYKRLFITFLICYIQVYCFSETTSVITNTNKYNGTSEKIEFSEEENSNFSARISHYDNNRVIRQIDLFPTVTIMSETGILKQTLLLNENEVIEKYDIDFTEEYFSIHGVNKIIEYVDNNDNVTRQEWYKDDLFVDYLEDTDIASRFPFYRLDFLVKEVLEDYQAEDNSKEVITSSARYRGIRTVVNMDNEIIPINDIDKQIITFIGNSLGNYDILKYYSNKTYVEEDGKEYCLYIQNGLEQYILQNDFSTIRYYFIGYNKKLYLALVTLTTYD